MSDENIVYVLSNPAMPGLIKIGITNQSSIDDRMGQLYTTGVPMPFECEYACTVNDAAQVEDALHMAFEPHRVNPKREFFKLEAERAIVVLRLLSTKEVTAAVNKEIKNDLSAGEVESAEKLKQSRRPRMNYHDMGIADGSILMFKDNITQAKVVDASHVEHNGDVDSLTAITKKLLNIDRPIQPAPYWSYNGKSLIDIYNETYASEE